MTSHTQSLNQVDLAPVGALVETIRTDESAAATTWAADVTWKGGFRSEARIRHFEPVASDEPGGLGGADTAPNPVEQLLGALGNCLAVGYAANASASGIALDDLEIKLEGDLDLRTFLGLTDGHAGYTGIRATVVIESDASPEALAQLHERVVGSSPVGHTLGQAIPVDIELANQGGTK